MKNIKTSLIVFILSSILFTLIYSCTKTDGSSAAANTGKNGSLTRFTVAGNYLYGVDNHYLYTYDLSNPKVPVKVATNSVNFEIETIYAYKTSLFLGTRTGLYIYSIANPALPQLSGLAQHARSCDPVVANDSIAYVTLKGSTSCGSVTSGLYVHNVKNLLTPTLITTIPLDDPEGLGIQDSALYVCCNSSGLKVFNISSGYSPLLKLTFTDGIYKDVIPYQKTLICYITKGLILYDITDPLQPVLIKRINN